MFFHWFRWKQYGKWIITTQERHKNKPHGMEVIEKPKKKSKIDVSKILQTLRKQNNLT